MEGSGAGRHQFRNWHADRSRRHRGRPRRRLESSGRSARWHPGTDRSSASIHRRRGAIAPGYYAVSTTAMTEEELSWFVDNTAVTKRLLGIEGVAQVSRGGGVDREIRIEPRPDAHAGARHHGGGSRARSRARSTATSRRARAGGRRRAGDPVAPRRRRTLAGAALRNKHHPVRRPHRATLRTSRRVRDSVAEISRLLEAQRAPGNELRRIPPRRGSSDVTVEKAVAAEIEEIKKILRQVRRQHLHQRRQHEAAVRVGDDHADRGLAARRRRGVPVPCGIGAPPPSRRRDSAARRS